MWFERGRSAYIYPYIIILSGVIFCRNVYGGTPCNVRVTNVRGTQFAISWTSAMEEIGRVRYGTSTEYHAGWSIKNDDRGAATTDDIHHVTITGLTSNTTYYYEIVSGGTIDDKGGNYYSLNPGPALIPPVDSCQPAGKVFKDQAKTQPAYDSIVYVTILGSTEDLNSAPESFLVTPVSNGYWFLNLVNFRTRDYSALYLYACGTSQIRVQAQGGNDGAAGMITGAIDFSTAESTALILTNATDAGRMCCLSSGLNLFGYPVGISEGYTSYQLLKDLGTEDEIHKIQRYDPNTGDYKTTLYENGDAHGDVFNIVNGEGYIIYMKAQKAINISGSIVNPSLALKEGPNFISLPCIPTGYPRYDLLSYLGSPDEVSNIQGFNRKKGTFETTLYFYGRASGNNTVINSNDAYIVHMKVNKCKNSPQ